MATGKRNLLRRWALAAVASALVLPGSARALGEANQALLPGTSGLYTPAVLFAPYFDWRAANPLQTAPAWTFAKGRYRSWALTAEGGDAGALTFDIGSYDAMWDDSMFSEMAAYGGLGPDLERVSAMQAMGGANSAGIPYGRLTLVHDFLNGRDRIVLGAYGSHADVRPTAISGFGDDGYTDLAADVTWRWTLHPERTVSDAISAHVLILHEGESLMASHAVFGAGRNDELTVVRGDVRYACSGGVAPAIQFFQITGTSDPLRLASLDGIPDSSGWIAEMEYVPKQDSPLARLNLHLAVEFVAYSEFDGANIHASANDTVLLHVTVGGDVD